MHTLFLSIFKNFMFSDQSDSPSNTTNEFSRINIHAKALQKLFIDIQDGKYLSELKVKYNKAISNKVNTPHDMLKSLEKIESSVKNTKKDYEKQLQKIEGNKINELLELLKGIKCSKEKLIKHSEQINNIINKKEPTEDILQAHIQQEIKKLNDVHIDIMACHYLHNPDKDFNALEIVQKYEKTYMNNIYSPNTDSSLIISSCFTNPSHNKDIGKSVDIINTFILNNTGSNSISDHSTSSYKTTSSTSSSVLEHTEPYFLQSLSMNSTFTDKSMLSILGDNDESDAS